MELQTSNIDMDQNKKERGCGMSIRVKAMKIHKREPNFDHIVKVSISKCRKLQHMSHAPSILIFSSFKYAFLYYQHFKNMQQGTQSITHITII